jgi:hypothetical protein
VKSEFLALKGYYFVVVGQIILAADYNDIYQ